MGVIVLALSKHLAFCLSVGRPEAVDAAPAAGEQPGWPGLGLARSLHARATDQQAYWWAEHENGEPGTAMTFLLPSVLCVLDDNYWGGEFLKYERVI